MLIAWALLYWAIGIAFIAVWNSLSGGKDSDFDVIGSTLWPVLLVMLILIGFYQLIYGAVEKLIRWIMK